MVDVLELFDQLAQVGNDGNQAQNDSDARSCDLLEIGRVIRDVEATHAVYEWCEEILSKECPSTVDMSKASNFEQQDAIVEKYKAVHEKRRTLTDKYGATLLMQDQRFDNIEQKFAKENTKLDAKEMRLVERERGLAERERRLAKRERKFVDDEIESILKELKASGKGTKFAEDRASIGEEISSTQGKSDDIAIQTSDLEGIEAAMDRHAIAFREYYTSVLAEPSEHPGVPSAMFSRVAPSLLDQFSREDLTRLRSVFDFSAFKKLKEISEISEALPREQLQNVQASLELSGVGQRDAAPDFAGQIATSTSGQTDRHPGGTSNQK